MVVLLLKSPLSGSLFDILNDRSTYNILKKNVLYALNFLQKFWYRGFPLLKFPLSGSLFEILDEPLCYVIQCSPYAKFDALMLTSLYEMCIGVLHYIYLYTLNLHSTFAHLWVPFSLGVSWNKRMSASQSNELKFSLYITQTETYLWL